MKVSTFLLFLVVHATWGPIGGGAVAAQDEIPIADMTRGELIMAGVGLDPDSLIEAAQQHASPTVRAAAVEVLGLRHFETAGDLVRELARNDDDPLVQRTAAHALARFGEEEGFDLLRTALEVESSPMASLLIAGQLAELGDASGYPKVVAALAAESAEIRRLAVRYLGPFAYQSPAADDEEAFRLLVGMGEDTSPEVRLEALSALVDAAREGSHSQDIVDAILERAANEDPDPEVRRKLRQRLDYQRWWDDHQEWLKRHANDGSGS